MSELQFIELNERAYKYIRQFTIRSAEDALVELITNCVDAYKLTDIENREIEIEYHKPNIIKVRDHAIGLTAEEMKNCFLQVGNYTTNEGSRGFFSRGAKDISAIGNITFNSIKNGKHSQCYLNSDAYGKMNILDVDVTVEQREGLKIQTNGLEVTIELLANFIIDKPSVQYDSLCNLATLRDIIVDDNNNLTYTIYENDIEIFKERIIFEYPPAEILLDLDYTVPNYPDATAKFIIYKTEKQIPQPKKETEMIFGFLIKDDTTIYETSTIDDRFRWIPYMNRLYGYLKCNYISHLLLDYDKNGSTELNPMPIIDPSRLTGVNKKHPFIDSLLSIPRVRLDQILRELNKSLSQQSISLKEADQLLEELSKYGLDIIEEEDIKVTYTQSYDDILAKAIEDDRINYVNSEKNYYMNINYDINISETDNYIRDKIVRLENIGQDTSFIIDGNNELVQIPYEQTDEKNEMVDIMTIIDKEETNLSKHPYIYKLGPNGELVKLYIFEKGRIENITNPEEEYIIVKNKKFNISFINDLNLSQRYLIEYNEGVNIKLNLNNDSISKYLTTNNITSGSENLSIQNLSSSNSLVFLQELMIEIISEVILENNILNNKLVLDSNNFNNNKKINSHKNEITSKLEMPIGSIFTKYIGAVKQQKIKELQSNIDNISNIIGETIDNEYELQLANERDLLSEKLQLLVE